MKQTAPIRIKKRESADESYLYRQCATRGWDCWKLTSKKGQPDRLVLADNGVMALVELKREGGKVSSLQARTLANLQERGFEAFILVGRDDIDQLIGFLERKAIQ